MKLRESPLDEVHETNKIDESESTEESPQEPTPMIKPCLRAIERTTSSSDSTINLEILKQLRNLGEELRNDRFKKEQKHYIKQIVNKELNKSRAEQGWQGQRIRSKYVPDLIPICETDIVKQQENELSEPQQVVTVPQEPQQVVPQEPQPEPPIFRSRIRR